MILLLIMHILGFLKWNIAMPHIRPAKQGLSQMFLYLLHIVLIILPIALHVVDENESETALFVFV